MRSLCNIGLLTCFGMLLTACFPDSECISLLNNNLGIGFKGRASQEDTTLSVTDVSLSNSSYTFSASQTPVGGVDLPLNPSLQRRRITFTFPSPSGPDMRVLVVAYRVQTQFISEDCDPRFVLSNVAVVYHTFDSAKVVNTVPGSEPGSVNIEIVY